MSVVDRPRVCWSPEIGVTDARIGMFCTGMGSSFSSRPPPILERHWSPLMATGHGQAALRR